MLHDRKRLKHANNTSPESSERRVKEKGRRAREHQSFMVIKSAAGENVSKRLMKCVRRTLCSIMKNGGVFLLSDAQLVHKRTRVHVTPKKASLPT